MSKQHPHAPRFGGFERQAPSCCRALLEHPAWGPTQSLPKQPANIPTPRHHPVPAKRGAPAPPVLSDSGGRADPHPCALLPGGCFTSPHPASSPREKRGKYLRRNKAMLSLFPNPCPGCTAISCKLTPGPTCAQKGKGSVPPCVTAEQMQGKDQEGTYWPSIFHFQKQV